jgi:uncharacterized protein YdaU (DUF1376 family)
MHYYQFHVSDYIHDTAHLSIEEDLAFRRLLDLYYTQEKPIPNRTQEVARRIRMAKYEHSIQIVLEEFFMFDIENDCWTHKRCDETIFAYQAKAERNRQIGKLGGRPKANHVITQKVSKDNPNQEPITINHKPTIEKTHRGSRLPTDFVFPKEWADFCIQQRPDLNLQQTFDSFKDYWVSAPKGTKLDWFATWRNWVRNQSTPKANKFDVVLTTTPPPPNQDAALKRILEDDKKASRPSLEVLAKMAEVKRKIA